MRKRHLRAVPGARDRGRCDQGHGARLPTVGGRPAAGPHPVVRTFCRRRRSRDRDAGSNRPDPDSAPGADGAYPRSGTGGAEHPPPAPADAAPEPTALFRRTERDPGVRRRQRRPARVSDRQLPLRRAQPALPRRARPRGRAGRDALCGRAAVRRFAVAARTLRRVRVAGRRTAVGVHRLRHRIRADQEPDRARDRTGRRRAPLPRLAGAATGRPLPRQPVPGVGGGVRRLPLRRAHRGRSGARGGGDRRGSRGRNSGSTGATSTLPVLPRSSPRPSPGSKSPACRRGRSVLRRCEPMPSSAIMPTAADADGFGDGARGHSIIRASRRQSTTRCVG